MVDFHEKLKEKRMADKTRETITKKDVGRLEDAVPGLVKEGMATTGTTAVSTERRSFIPEGDHTGTEDIGLNDIKLPALRVAQGLSYQMLPNDPRYIKGLALFEMFNDLTGEIYGNGPLKFVPILREVHRIEFDPDKRGVPLDVNVPENDPRMQWTKNPEAGKKDLPPRATKYVDFVILLVHQNRKPEPMILSIKCTNKQQTLAATRLSGFLKFQDCPIFGAYKEIRSTSVTNEDGTYGVYVIDNGKRLDAPGQTDEEWDASMKLYREAEAFHKSLKGKTIVVDREAPDPDEFNPADIEREAAARDGESTPRM